jgi:hypothetical protein
VIILARLAPLAVAAMMAADTPPSPPAGSTPTPAAVQPASDDDIRATFVGKAACPPQPWPVGVGPHEFRADGTYARSRDLATAHGRYTIADGRICITLADSSKPDFCLAVLKDGPGYTFRLDDAPPRASTHSPVPVEPCSPDG